MDTLSQNSAIKEMTFRESVRRRPGMYIGSTNAQGMHSMAREIMEGAAIQGIAKDYLQIHLVLHRDGGMTVADNGAGVPDVLVTGDSGERMPLAEMVLTTRKICRLDGFAELLSLGLHGMGFSCVVALAEYFRLETACGGKAFVIECERGLVTRPWQCVGVAAETGTRITFKPDGEIFADPRWDVGRIRQMCRQRSRLQGNVRFVVTDMRGDAAVEECVRSPGGFEEEVREMGRGLELFPVPLFRMEANYPFAEPGGAAVVSAALAFTGRKFSRVASFVNFLASPDGGTHVEGFKLAVEDAFEMAGVPRGMRSGLRRGMLGAVHVMYPRPNWEGCTRSKVSTPELVELVRLFLRGRMARWMEAHLAGGSGAPGDGAECSELACCGGGGGEGGEEVREYEGWEVGR